MAGAWITDMRHYLTEEGRLGEMPAPAFNLARYFGSIVAWVTSRPTRRISRTNVPCRRTRERRRCPGDIHAGLDTDPDVIVWQCTECGDYGFIRGWEGTTWDRR